MPTSSGPSRGFAVTRSKRGDAPPSCHVRPHFPVETEQDVVRLGGPSTELDDHAAVVTPVVASVVFAKITGALPLKICH